MNDDNIAIFRRFFPNSRLEVLDTGHWGKQGVKFLSPPYSDADEISFYLVHAERYVIPLVGFIRKIDN